MRHGYATWMRERQQMDCIVEAFLAYWLPWYILLSGPDNGLNLFIFLLAIQIAKGSKLALPPLYLGCLYTIRSVSKTSLSQSGIMTR